VVEIENVTKTFGDVRAVDDLSLNVPQGSIYGFIGPNGSGKTTTLRMVMNIYYPDSGRIRVFGREMHGASTERIGYLPEERGLYKKMKVRDLLRFFGDLKSGRKVDKRWMIGQPGWNSAAGPAKKSKPSARGCPVSTAWRALRRPSTSAGFKN
jgi:ABC-2 type transport system ATP-binding protein